jgi:phage-related protein
MSKLTYTGPDLNEPPSVEKPLVWLHGEVKTPPFSAAARVEAGFRLRQLQSGERVPMPHSRSMPSIGRRCHELRITDANVDWRLIYRIDNDAVVIVEVFAKKSAKTPAEIIETCHKRLKRYDDAEEKAKSPRS